MPITKASGNSVTAAAKGDLVVGNATNDSGVLSVGANNTVLTADSSTATGLKWAAAAGGGKVLQVVSGTTNTATTIATTAYTDTGISLSITPTSATSKVLILISASLYYSRSSTIQLGSNQIVRGSTSVFETFYTGYEAPSGNNFIYYLNPFTYLDSPATTSSTTYKLQAKVAYTNLGGQVVYQPNSYSTITLLEIGA